MHADPAICLDHTTSGCPPDAAGPRPQIAPGDCSTCAGPPPRARCPPRRTGRRDCATPPRLTEGTDLRNRGSGPLSRDTVRRRCLGFVAPGPRGGVEGGGHDVWCLDTRGRARECDIPAGYRSPIVRRRRSGQLLGSLPGQVPLPVPCDRVTVPRRPRWSERRDNGQHAMWSTLRPRRLRRPGPRFGRPALDGRQVVHGLAIVARCGARQSRLNRWTASELPKGPRMHRFQATLVSGRKRPYTAWTFLVIPPDLAMRWGPGQKPVRGTISGYAFRGTASRGEGALRVPIPRAFREKAGLNRGDTVDAALELDAAPPPVPVPDELRAVLEDDPEAAALYDGLPPSHRRAWASYVAEAKRPETRLRRARRAPDGIRARDFPS